MKYKYLMRNLEGVIEVKEVLNIDVTKDGRIVGLELLDASKKTSLNSFFTYEISEPVCRSFSESRTCLPKL